MKRFSDTGRFDEEWFMDLSVDFKLGWEYIWARCDNAGVWRPNKKLGDFHLGKKLAWDDFQARLEEIDKITTLENGDWLIAGFINFQCGTLSAACRPHFKVFELLEKHGIEYAGGELFGKRSRRSTVTKARRELVFERDGNACVYCGSTESLQPDHIHPRKLQGSCKPSNLLTACKACNAEKMDKPLSVFLENKDYRDRVLEYVYSLSDSSDRAQYKDTEGEEDSGVDRGSGGKEGATKSRNPKPPKFVKPVRAEFDAYVTGHLGMTQNDADHAWNSYENNGWTRAQGGNRISLTSWPLALNTWKTGGYFPSQKGSSNSRSHSASNGYVPPADGLF